MSGPPIVLNEENFRVNVGFAMEIFGLIDTLHESIDMELARNF